jgi:hypothetical protein
MTLQLKLIIDISLQKWSFRAFSNEKLHKSDKKNIKMSKMNKVNQTMRPRKIWIKISIADIYRITPKPLSCILYHHSCARVPYTPFEILTIPSLLTDLSRGLIQNVF